MSIKKAYAANTELKTVRDYNRIFIFINQTNLEIPVLLERKKIKIRQNFHNPKIFINGNILINRTIWNEKLDDLLVENVKIYQSIKGKKLIPWKIIQNKVKDFNECSSGALRERFVTIRKKYDIINNHLNKE